MQQITTDWHWKNYAVEARQYYKKMGLSENCMIYVLTNNCSTHPDAKSLFKNNIIVIYLPPNCTSLIQPMDQGVIQRLKCNYRK